jgi:hypothetical protein
MKAFPKVGLLAVVALLAAAAVAPSAQAQTISPNDTPVSGGASNVTMTYGNATTTCDSVTLSGNTDLNSDRISNLALTFSGCAIAGVGAATVNCSGTVTFIAQSAAGDTGTIHLNDGFRCDITTALCTITFGGPQTTQNNNTALNESTDVLSADWELQATRTGSSLCGPTSGTMHVSANFGMTPSTLAIGP